MTPAVPGHRQYLSRTAKAWRNAPSTTRLERPTSITSDSSLSRTRVTLQSHAIRRTESFDSGTENSISPAADPTSPLSVSRVAVT